MAEVTFNGLIFEPYITREQIAEQIKRVAQEIKNDLRGEEKPIFVGVLTGSFMFASDLYREIDIYDSEIAFIRFKSYEGMQSSGVIKEVMGLDEDIKGRTVIIIEDIVDTGITAARLRARLEALGPKQVKMASLLFKPESLQEGNPPEYVCFSIPSRFILGYGLDLDGVARNLPEIYVLKDK